MVDHANLITAPNLMALAATIKPQKTLTLFVRQKF